MSRPRPDVPEFSDILVGIVKNGLFPEKPLERGINHPVIGIAASRNAQQNIRVDQM